METSATLSTRNLKLPTRRCSFFHFKLSFSHASASSHVVTPSEGFLSAHLRSIYRDSGGRSVWKSSGGGVGVGRAPRHEVHHLRPGQRQLPGKLRTRGQRRLVVQQVRSKRRAGTPAEGDSRMTFSSVSSLRCHSAHLNGVYYSKGHYSAVTDDGIVWYTWRGWWYSLKTTIMKLRPTDFRVDPADDPGAVPLH